MKPVQISTYFRQVTRTILSASLIGCLLLGCSSATKEPNAAVESAASAISWSPWSAEIFARAEREDRLVILHLGAVWCHWCHVMEETTYRDPRVLALLSSGYLPIYVDQDARPDLSSRYEDYGWPATIIFNGRGEELAKLRGYIEPDRMVSTLDAFIKDPTPGPSVRPTQPLSFGEQSQLSSELKASLEATYLKVYDSELGGWGKIHKYVDSDLIELALRRNDATSQEMVKKTLTAATALLDPVWGGIYQYSDSGVWTNPHFEKIMSFQAAYIRTYAAAFYRSKNSSYETVGREVARFLRQFLKGPEGAFYVSQDADVIKGEHSAEFFALNDKERRAKGIPSVDTHQYARENGWAIEALSLLYAVTEDETYLKEAQTAVAWVEANRLLPEGGFRHDSQDASGPYLADTLSMARAYLALYRVTAERAWLQKAAQAAGFIDANFAAADAPGYMTAKAQEDSMPANKPLRTVDENIALARFANLLWRYTGEEPHKGIAVRAMQYITSPDVANNAMGASAGILLADDEMGRAPAMLLVIGEKTDPSARALFQEAKRAASLYLRLEWRSAEEAQRADERLPASKTSAAFLCTEARCSDPLQSPEALQKAIATMAP